MSFNINVLVHKQNLAPVNVLTPFSMINNKPSDLVKAPIYIIQPVFCVNFSLHPAFSFWSVSCGPMRAVQRNLQWIECCLHVPNLIHWLLSPRSPAWRRRLRCAHHLRVQSLRTKGKLRLHFPQFKVLEQCHWESLFVDSGCSFGILVWWANHKLFHWNLAQHYQKEAMTTTLLSYKQKERMKSYRSYVQI